MRMAMLPSSAATDTARRESVLWSRTFRAASLLGVLGLRFVPPPTTAFVLAYRVATPGPTPVDRRWVPMARIAPSLAIAVVAAEDQTFPAHHGFDLESIGKAWDERGEGRVRGASTISQQVAKNLFLWRGQSWFRKALEAGITVLIEACWSKQRILEVYLNVAEFGRGTYGVQAASERFFRKDARRLSRSEAALLAAVLPAPSRFKVQAPTRYVQRRQAWIQRQMAALGGAAYLARLD
jgi:monofunctional biosynthetic peptidoglycan transglycosylase